MKTPTSFGGFAEWTPGTQKPEAYPNERHYRWVCNEMEALRALCGVDTFCDVVPAVQKLKARP